MSAQEALIHHTEPTCIAEVAVSRPVGRLLDYAVPTTMRPCVGARVLLPLGHGRATGLIMAIKQASQSTNLRSIIELIDEGPVLDEALVETLRFALSWYRAEPSEVVRAALPAGLGVDTVKALVRVPDTPLPLDLHHLEDRLAAQGGLQARELDNRVLSRLLRSGAVRSDTRLQKAKPEPRVEWLRSCIHPDDFPARAKAQKQVLETLYNAGGWQPAKRLAGVKGLRRLIRELLRKGAVESQQRSWVDTDLQPSDQPPELNTQQRSVVTAIGATNGFAQHVLFGVTGSGKTEVYLRAIAEVLKRGKQALVLVPEIALTPQMVQRFGARFGTAVAVLHSALAPGQRRSAWHRAQRGEAQVVIGARSAVFASLPNLGLLVVDEEHDGSYKQADGFRYHARDLAIIRAQHVGIPVVLGSATPSLETYQRALDGQHHTHLHRLDVRATGASMPSISVVDLRGSDRGQYPLSQNLCTLMEQTLARQEQAMLLLNRRGWAPSMLCLDCGHRLTCPDCSVPLVLHRGGASVCHWCGHHRPAPKRCPDCSSSALIDAGIGTQQLEAACKERFEGARVARLDSDTARSPQRMERILKAMAEGEIDILVGTQMLAKGHDLAGVTLVGVVCADQGLRIPDPRCAERTFSLLTQVAGRAGRAGRPGRVVFQAFDPKHPAVAYAADHDAERFYREELEQRERLGLPPFSRAAIVRCEHAERSQAEAAAARFAALQQPDVRVFGPLPAVVEKLRGRYRFQVLASSKTARSLQAWLDKVQAARSARASRGTRVLIDVDPMELV